MSKTTRRQTDLPDEDLVAKAERKARRKDRPAGRFLAMIDQELDELNLALADRIEQIRYEPAQPVVATTVIDPEFMRTGGVLFLDELL